MLIRKPVYLVWAPVRLTLSGARKNFLTMRYDCSKKVIQTKYQYNRGVLGFLCFKGDAERRQFTMCKFY